MAAVSQFFQMTSKQQTIESTWYSILKELATGKDFTEVILPFDAKTKIGSDGIASLAQRRSRFNNSQVEVMEDAMTDRVRIRVLAPGSLERRADTESDSDVNKKAAKTPRPPNSFILYRQSHHPSVVAQNPGMHNNQISQLIGKMWKSEPQSVRDDWKRKAEEAKTKHEKEHPNYQYQPRKPSEKKRRMTKRKADRLAAATAAAARQPAAQQPLPSMTFNVTLEMPSFDFSTGSQTAIFTFDPAQENQIALFNELLENHNTLTTDPAVPGLDAPAASASLPTAAHTNQYNFDIAAAEAELFNFEENLEDQLARELEKLDEQKVDILPGYNDNEAQRFTDFLDQMPTDMWGMEFISML